MSEKITVVVKRAGQPMQVVTMDNTLDAFQEITGTDDPISYITCAAYNSIYDKIICWHNDNGKLKGLPINFDWIKDGIVQDFLVGDVVFTGTCYDSFSECEDCASLTDEKIDKLKKAFQNDSELNISLL